MHEKNTPTNERQESDSEAFRIITRPEWSEEGMDALLSKIDLENPGQFIETLKKLILLENLWGTSYQYMGSLSGDIDKDQRIERHFTKLLIDQSRDSETGIYFLKLIAQKIVETITSKDRAIFAGQDVVTGEDEQSQILNLLENDLVRKLIKDEFSLVLENLSADNKFYFWDNVKDKTKPEIEDVKQLLKTFGNDGLKSFRALRFDPKAVEKLIAVNKNLGSQNSIAQVLGKFAEFADASDHILDYLKENFSGKQNYDNETQETIAQNLLHRGALLLNDYLENIAQEDIDPDEVAKGLEEQKLEIAILLASFKKIRPKLETIRTASFEQVLTPLAETLPSKDIEKMRAIYAANYQNKPKLQELLLAAFDEGTRQSGGEYYIFKHADEVRAFLRFIDRGEEIHFGAFNVDPAYQGAALGEEIMLETLDVKAGEKTVIAECDLLAPISPKYIERGFVGQSIESKEEIAMLNIRWDKKLNETLQSKQLDWIPTTGENIIIEDLKLNNQNNLEALITQFSNHFKNGFILTRYLKGNSPTDYQLVFEKPGQTAISS